MRKSLENVIVRILVLLVIVAVLLPIFWMALTSLKPEGEVFAWPPTLIFRPVVDAYLTIYGSGWWLYFMNTIIVSVSSAALALAVGLTGAYAVARFDIPRKEFFAFTVLSVRMIPPVVVVIPLYLMISFMGLRDTYPGLVLVYAVFLLPYVIWIMRGFIEQVPRDIEEAAQLDGCSTFGAFTRALLPIVRPGLAATLLFSMIMTWNEFLVAFVISGQSTQTVPVAAMTLVGFQMVYWARVCATGVLLVIPPIVMAFLMQRWLVRGFTMGMVKG